MNLCLLSTLLGTERNLLYDGVSYSWVNVIPDNVWTVGQSNIPSDLLWSMHVAGAPLPRFPNDAYRAPWKELRANKDIGVPWFLSLPTKTFKGLLSDMVRHLWSFLNDESNRYYLDDLKQHRELLENLLPAKVDTGRLHKHFHNLEQSALKASLEKFSPDESGFIQKIAYDQAGSVTGRLTVREGPNILTLKKKYRDIFQSQFNNGKLVQVDIRSLEPRIAMYLAGQECEGDIYKSIFDQLDITIEREIAKKIIISTLYGMTPRNLRKMMPQHLEITKISKEIRSFFQIQKLEEKIQYQIKDMDYFTNHYGRKLKESNSLINHFLQSTGVDVSLCSFSYLIKELQKNRCNFYPLFVIHDALILDIDNKDLNTLAQIVNNDLVAPEFDQRFPAQLSLF